MSTYVLEYVSYVLTRHREHFEEAMKYARRSVSEQDIRRYDMFAQVRDMFPSLVATLTDAYGYYRTCNNRVASVRSNSQKAAQPQQGRSSNRLVKGMPDSKKPKRRIFTHKP